MRALPRVHSRPRDGGSWSRPGKAVLVRSRSFIIASAQLLSRPRLFSGGVHRPPVPCPSVCFATLPQTCVAYANKLRLLIPPRSALTRSVSAFECSGKENPVEPEILGDLAAAQLVRHNSELSVSSGEDGGVFSKLSELQPQTLHLTWPWLERNPNNADLQPARMAPLRSSAALPLCVSQSTPSRGLSRRNPRLMDILGLQCSCLSLTPRGIDE
uniref:Uncharacterized protein n=1 Tax=Macrostomum lignano TaxID=282301 RepID=A0A1I8FET7_9PLAT